MKIIKIVGGSVLALYALALLPKLLRTLPLIASTPFGVSRALGSVAGILIAGVTSYLCFRSAFAEPKTPVA